MMDINITFWGKGTSWNDIFLMEGKQALNEKIYRMLPAHPDHENTMVGVANDITKWLLFESNLFKIDIICVSPRLEYVLIIYQENWNGHILINITEKIAMDCMHKMGIAIKCVMNTIEFEKVVNSLKP